MHSFNSERYSVSSLELHGEGVIGTRCDCIATELRSKGEVDTEFAEVTESMTSRGYGFACG